jgi:hypothetical protein
MTQIPDRSTSRYAGHYARAVDPQRLIQILSESHAVALNSQVPSTAQARFELAVEAYHQLMAMTLPMDVRLSLEESMINLADQFPVHVCLNEANGLRTKAGKLKTARQKLKYLQRARDILRTRLDAEPSAATDIESMYNGILADIGDVEASAQTAKGTATKSP